MPVRIDQSTDPVQFIFADEPEYCHALNRNNIAKYISKGLWIVYYCAQWSIPDLSGVETALGLAKSLNGAAQLGICAFDDFADIAERHTEVTERYVSPLWVVSRDGAVLGWLSGLGVCDTIRDIIHKETSY